MEKMITRPILRDKQQKLNLLVKVVAVFSVVIMLMFLAVTYRNLLGYVGQNEEIRRSHKVITDLEQVLSVMKDAETGARGYLLSNDVSFLQPYDEATATFPPLLKDLSEELQGDFLSAAEFSVALKLIVEKQDLLESMISQQRYGPGPPGRPDTLVLQQSKDRMDQLRDVQRTLIDRYSRILHHQESDDRELKWAGPGMLALFAGLALLCIAGLFMWAFRAVERAQEAERVALHAARELDREARERELAERSLKRVLDSSQSGIMAFRSIRDEQGRIVDFECTRVNEAAEAIFHKKAEEMMHHSMTEIRLENRRSPLFASYVRIVESGEPLRAETVFTRDGQVSTLSISAVRLLDGLVITFTDITEAKRQATLMAEGERLSVTGRFARMVGHEVRNPLTNIQLALDQLESEGTAPDQRIYLDILRRNSQRIGQLITEMLHTSRPLEMKLVPGQVNDVLADALARVKDRCELRKAKCNTALDPAIGEVPIDSSTLTVAFTNLLVNAVEAMEEGKGQLEIRSERVKDRVQVTIGDNGKGMSAEDRERIYQPFFSGRKGGMGLGLTEARNIFNAHGVLLTVESELGKGTTFKLLFPA